MNENALIALNIILRLTELLKSTGGNVTDQDLDNSLAEMKASGIRLDNLLGEG